ncbi:2-dehydro-3-deoxygalactonokinase [Nioella nitratireducens]|uniref:2-dehydro-3-deoxygalactonokinase n=1 Tax=Nioella nitratireducens TaxID=1287720 RepID=UPI001313DCAE|nr:2-dehydro-3-deoxygalactonokinase [Nioella nitratireducens]
MAGPEWVAVDRTADGINAWAVGSSGSIIMRARSAQRLTLAATDDLEAALLEVLDPWLTNGPVPIVASGLPVGPLLAKGPGMIDLPCAPSEISPIAFPTTDPRLNLYVLPKFHQAAPIAATDGEEGLLRGVFVDLPEFDGMVCTPGLESRWAEVQDRRLVSLRGFVTGAIRNHFATEAALDADGEAFVDPGFDRDVFRRSVKKGLTFPEALTLHIADLLSELRHGTVEAVTARVRLAGKLIGVELAAMRDTWIGRQIIVIGSGLIASLYTTALETQGVPVMCRAREELSLVGLKHAYASLSEIPDRERRRT